MKIGRVKMSTARNIAGVGQAVTDYDPKEGKWNGWACEVRGASVYLIGPDTPGKGSEVIEIPRLHCEIRWVLSPGEKFEPGGQATQMTMSGAKTK